MRHTLTYIAQRGLTYVYRRRIPKGLHKAFSKAAGSYVVITLKTKDKYEAHVRGSEIHKIFDANVANAKAGVPLRPFTYERPPITKEEAAKLLLQELWGNKDLDLDGTGFDTDDVALSALQDLLSDHLEENPGSIETLINVNKLAHGNTIDEPITPSLVVHLYLEAKNKLHDSVFRKPVDGALKAFIHHCGDLDLRYAKKIRAKKFIDKLQFEGLSNQTIKRRLGALSAAVNSYKNYHTDDSSININNIFMGHHLEDTTKKREELSPETIITLQSNPVAPNVDDVGAIIDILLDTGLRISECAGLMWTDVHLEEDIPYLSITQHPHRSLKTKSSARDIPLVGKPFAQFKQRQRQAYKSRFVFPRWNKRGITNGNSVSASVNKRLRKLESNISAHSLRHTFVTRMRDVEAPLEVIQYILGHRIPGEAMTGGYGSKKLLSLKHRYILMIAGFAAKTS